jgi:hypothetical protein
MLVLPPKLRKATPRDEYIVRLCFDDGLSADVDLSYLLEFGGVFEPLHDVEFFRQLRISEGRSTIEWPNEADIAPETLYDHVQRAVYEQKRAAVSNPN